MEHLTPIWLDMVHAWIERGAEDKATVEVDARLAEFGINWERESDSYKDGVDYDTERAMLKKEAQRLVALIRFSHPSFKMLPDNDAFRHVRMRICEQTSLRKFKAVNKMTNDELREFNAIAKGIYHRFSA
jgi:hypothetical protein